MNRSKLWAAALLACLPLHAYANPGWFVGIDAGSTEADATIKDSFLVDDINAREAGSSSGIRLRGGYQFGRFFALELSLADFGDFEYTFDPEDCPDGGRTCAFIVSTGFRELSLSMVGILPLGDRWFLNARAGVSEMWARSRQLDSGDRAERSDEAGLHVGVGVGFKLDDQWQFLLSHTRIESLDFAFDLENTGAFGVYDMGDATLTSIGVSYHW